MRKLDLETPGMEYEGEYIDCRHVRYRGNDATSITIRDPKGELVYFFVNTSLMGIESALNEAARDGYRARVVLRTHGVALLGGNPNRRIFITDWAVGRYLKTEKKPTWSWALADLAVPGLPSPDTHPTDEPRVDVAESVATAPAAGAPTAEVYVRRRV